MKDVKKSGTKKPGANSTVRDFVRGCYMAPRTEWQHVLKYGCLKVCELDEGATGELQSTLAMLVEFARLSKWSHTRVALSGLLAHVDARAAELAEDVATTRRLRSRISERPDSVREFVKELDFWRTTMKAAERRGLNWREMLGNGCPEDFLEMKPMRAIPAARR